MDFPSEVRSYADMRRGVQLGRVLAPHLEGASQTWKLAHCIGWPVPAANPPHPLHVRGVPPILIVHATHDGSTNYRWATGVAAQIDRAVLLTRHGDGHTSYFASPRARAAIDRYLITRVTPSPGFACRD
jgi:TAP-like protein